MPAHSGCRRFLRKAFSLTCAPYAMRKAPGKILATRPDEVAPVDFPLGKINIDTMDDYHALLA